MSIKRLAITLPVLLLLVTQGLSVRAHGGGQLVAGPVQTGPYTLSVWVNPPQPRAGEPLHFTVGVAAPENGAPVLDTEILVTMQAIAQDSAPVSALATTDQSINKLFYETDLEVTQPGRYLATVGVVGPKGEGELSLELDVKSPSPINWFLFGLAGLLLVLALAWWRTRRSREGDK